MATLRAPALTLEERAGRHRLIVRDSLALSSLLSIVVALIFVTYVLFHSFTEHRHTLETRWQQRGEAELAQGKAGAAVLSLRSALASAPDSSTLQTELAKALVADGRLNEALGYFNNLHDAKPGDGMINLQLARLSVKQGNVQAAITHYNDALDGTWYGDGFLRRREVRIELSRYLIAQQQFEEARNQLLIAAGNAADNHGLQLAAAGLLEQAQGQQEAFELYRRLVSFRDTRTAALIGAGRTASSMSHFRVARNMLGEATGQPDFARLPEAEQTAARSMLAHSESILALYPSENLPLGIRARRAAHLAEIAQGELTGCVLGGAVATPAPAQNAAPAAGTPDTAAGAQPAENVLRSAINAVVQRAQSIATLHRNDASQAGGSQPGQSTIPPAAKLGSLAQRWQTLPSGPALEAGLRRNPDTIDPTLALTYDTVQATTQACGATQSAGQTAALNKDAAALATISAAPDEIDQP